MELSPHVQSGTPETPPSVLPPVQAKRHSPLYLRIRGAARLMVALALVVGVPALALAASALGDLLATN